MRFEVYPDSSGRYRWRLWSGGNKIAVSGESFASEYNAERAAVGFKSGARVYIYAVFGGGARWYWHAKAGNGEKVASGGESFVTESNARRAATNVRDHAGSASGPT